MEKQLTQTEKLTLQNISLRKSLIESEARVFLEGLLRKYEVPINADVEVDPKRNALIWKEKKCPIKTSSTE